MRDRILKFLGEMDSWLESQARPGERLNLHLIGKAAVILFYGGDQTGAMTADVDVVQIGGIPEGLLSVLLGKFGRQSQGNSLRDLYLEVVSCGLPPMPQGFQSRSREFQGDWKVLRILQPDANDLAVSKLKRFAAKDRQDIQHLCDSGLLLENRLRDSLHDAFLFDADDNPARDDAYANMELVLAYLRGDSRFL